MARYSTSLRSRSAFRVNLVTRGRTDRVPAGGCGGTCADTSRSDGARAPSRSAGSNASERDVAAPRAIVLSTRLREFSQESGRRRHSDRRARVVANIPRRNGVRPAGDRGSDLQRIFEISHRKASRVVSTSRITGISPGVAQGLLDQTRQRGPLPLCISLCFGHHALIDGDRWLCFHVNRSLYVGYSAGNGSGEWNTISANEPRDSWGWTFMASLCVRQELKRTRRPGSLWP